MVPEASSKFLTDDLKFEMLDWQIMGRGEQKQKRDSLDSEQCGKVGPVSTQQILLRLCSVGQDSWWALGRPQVILRVRQKQQLTQAGH